VLGQHLACDEAKCPLADGLLAALGRALKGAVGQCVETTGIAFAVVAECAQAQTTERHARRAGDVESVANIALAFLTAQDGHRQPATNMRRE
jgi:hypothetical protein